jgi:hypothetical protein
MVPILLVMVIAVIAWRAAAQLRQIGLRVYRVPIAIARTRESSPGCGVPAPLKGKYSLAPAPDVPGLSTREISGVSESRTRPSDRCMRHARTSRSNVMASIAASRHGTASLDVDRDLPDGVYWTA